MVHFGSNVCPRKTACPSKLMLAVNFESIHQSMIAIDQTFLSLAHGIAWEVPKSRSHIKTREPPTNTRLPRPPADNYSPSLSALTTEWSERHESSSLPLSTELDSNTASIISVYVSITTRPLDESRKRIAFASLKHN